MKREEIIKMAEEAGLKTQEWWCYTSHMERFAALVELVDAYKALAAGQAEIIAAQQARITELLEVMRRLAFTGGSINSWDGVQKALSRTDDLSALNEHEAAKDARISELVEAVKYYSQNEMARFKNINDVGDKVLSRTDDLSALNEAKAQVLEDAAKKILLDNPMSGIWVDIELNRFAEELRENK